MVQCKSNSLPGTSVKHLMNTLDKSQKYNFMEMFNFCQFVDLTPHTSIFSLVS